jgi:hypothetical protein
VAEETAAEEEGGGGGRGGTWRRGRRYYVGQWISVDDGVLRPGDWGWRRQGYSGEVSDYRGGHGGDGENDGGWRCGEAAVELPRPWATDGVGGGGAVGWRKGLRRGGGRHMRGSRPEKEENRP